MTVERGQFAGAPLTVVAGKCGNTAHFEPDGLPSYRCEVCGAVVGSVAMPKDCRPGEQTE